MTDREELRRLLAESARRKRDGYHFKFHSDFINNDGSIASQLIIESGKEQRWIRAGESDDSVCESERTSIENEGVS
jgi:hypothetical protein